MKFIKDIITKKRQPPVESDFVEMVEQFDPTKSTESEGNTGDDLLKSLASIQSKIQGALGNTNRDPKNGVQEKLGSGPVDSFEDIVANIAKPTVDESKQKPVIETKPEVSKAVETEISPSVSVVPKTEPADEVSVTVSKTIKPTVQIAKKPILQSAQPDSQAAASETQYSDPVRIVKEPPAEPKPDASHANEKPAPGPRIVEVPAPSTGRTGRRAGRVKTRLLGFEQSQESSVDPFEAGKKVSSQAQVKFPVGWIVVIDGPGRGASFSLHNGVSQIGRGEDQAIKLDFGDNSISRSNHAAIAYDNEQRSFFLGHGGKANLVRLNDKPVLSTEEISNSDLIRIGETTLRFIGLCGSDFDWDVDNQEDIDDAAIA